MASKPKQPTKEEVAAQFGELFNSAKNSGTSYVKGAISSLKEKLKAPADPTKKAAQFATLEAKTRKAATVAEANGAIIGAHIRSQGAKALGFTAGLMSGLIGKPGKRVRKHLES